MIEDAAEAKLLDFFFGAIGDEFGAVAFHASRSPSMSSGHAKASCYRVRSWRRCAWLEFGLHLLSDLRGLIEKAKRDSNPYS